MKKITLQLLFLFISLSGYSQMALEGFEGFPAPTTTTLPTTWTLGTGSWSIFENNTPTTVGSVQSWGINAFAAALPYQGSNCASVSREQIGQGATSSDYLATPHILIPTNGELHFFTRMFTSGNQGTIYQIRVAPSPTAVPTDPLAYTQLAQQWTEADMTTTFNVYEEKIVDLSAYAGQTVYVSFVKIFTQPTANIDGDRWLVDNVSINTKCLVPTPSATTGITQNSATLNWANPSGATSWEVEIVLATATPTGTGTVYSGTLPYVIPPGTLLPNTAYKYYVRALCSTGYSSVWSAASAIFTTSTAPPVCGGNFVDAGGSTGQYANSSNITTTICPTSPGDVVTVTFTAFNTEATWDALYVYSGNAVVPANLISSGNPAGNVPGGLAGGYWGTAIPCPFTSSAADGCLTFVFRSDTSGQRDGWIANITCAPPPPCRVPTSISANTVTFNSAVLNWTQPANPDTSVASAWQVLLLPCGSPAPAAGATGYIDVNTPPPYNLLGLTPATCYDIYVRANCGSATSAWPCTPTTITTLAAPPVCGGNFVDAGGVAANYAANSNVTTTICPTTPGDVVTVTFTSFNTEATWDALYAYNGNAVVPANLIPSNNGAGNVPGGLAGGYWGTAIPCPFTSSAANGCLTFVFRSDGTAQNPGWVSNITCGPPPPCRIPTAITTNTVTHNSVILNWTQPANPDTSVASAWQVLALPCGSPAPAAGATGYIDVNTPPPYTLIGLNPTTCYDIYVRANCGSATSAWPCTPKTITTLIAPPVCGGVFVDAGGPAGQYANSSNITTTVCPVATGDVVTVTFSSFDTEATWDGLYVYDGNGVVPANLISSGNPAGNVPGGIAGSYWGNLTGANIPGPFTSTIANGGCLTFVFRSDGSGQRAGWNSTVTCAPPPTCLKPVTLTSTNITPTTALLGWTDTNIVPATQWEILVVPFGSALPLPTDTGTIVSTNPALITGLLPATRYTFYVRSVCSSTDSSNWSTGANFLTLIINDDCSGALFAPVNSSSVCQQVASGTVAGATASSGAIAPCIGTADDDAWYQFIATNPFLTVSLQNVVGSTTNLNFAVYSGSCGALTQVFCSAANNLSGVVNGLTIAQTYYIRVYSNGNTPQTSTFDLCISTPASCLTGQSACQNLNYQNTTGIASQGTIGCLGSSPNPTYYTINIQQTGPINLLLTQSTTPTGAPDLDVDYAAWGPFTDSAAACAAIGNPPTLAPGIGVPVTQTTGCSFSIAATENLNIVNAIAGQVYVILITNYSDDPGYISLTQTNATAPGAGIYFCCPNAYFTYTPVSYCKQVGTPNPIAVIAAGSQAGVFSSTITPGLVFANTSTGEVDLMASAPGNYLITNTVAAAGSCQAKSQSYSISIVEPTSATIAYTGSPYCQSVTALQTVTQTGTPGGYYSAVPNIGLSINPTTGAINPSLSSPGVYTVVYGLPGSVCTAGNPSTQVEILALPTIVQPAPVSACYTYTLPSLAVGNYFSQTGGVNPIDISVPITTSQTVYIYAVGANGCTNEKSFTVTINSVPVPTYTVAQSSCASPIGSITVTSPVGGGSPIPGNLFISEVTDANTGSLTYVEIYNGTGAPVNLSNYKLRTFNNGAASATTGCDNILSGTLNNGSTHVVAIGSATNLGSVVPNQVFAGCTGVNTDDCIKLTTLTDTVIDLWGRTDGTNFTPSNQVGYTYRRLNTATLPSTTWNPADWTALDPEDYTNVGTYALAVSNYQYSIDNGVTFQTPPTFSSLAPGTYPLVVKDIVTGCLSAPINIIIDAPNSVPSVTTFTYATPVCQNATTNPLPDTSAAGFTTGGVFTAIPSAGITINPTTGEINLATTTAGTYAITYTFAFNPSTCQTFSTTTFTIVITNVVPQVLGFSYTTPICQNASATLSPTLATGFTTGGTFSSTTGLSINGTTGVIDLANSTAGPYTVTYTIAGNTCQPTGVSTFDIVINPVITPVTTFTYTTPVCQNATTNALPDTSAAGFTTGGVFTSNPSTGITINPSTGEIDLPNTTAGTYVITYNIPAVPATCQLASSTSFTIVISNIITPVLGFSYTTPVCQNASATLSPTLVAGFTTGGTFSSTTGLSINGTSGVIDLANSTAGPYDITYAVAATTCSAASSSIFSIVINPVITPVTTFTYVTPVCQNATTNPIPDTTATGFTTGGTYTSNPATGITINSTTGEIDLANTTAGTYVITYDIPAVAASCQLASSTSFTIVINPIVTPVLGFSYTTPVCQNASATLSPTLAAGFATGATFSSTTGLSINSSTGVVNLATSTPGTYTITAGSLPNAATCLIGGTNTATLVINPTVTPVTGFSYSSPFCASETVNLQSPTLATGFTAGGTFTSTAGLSIDGTTGVINLANSTPGTYTVTYPINANPSICQLAGTGTAQVMIISPVTIEVTGGCQSVSYILTASPVGGSFNPETASYSWHDAEGAFVGNTQSITVTAAGTYTVTVTVDGCDTISLPFNVDSVFCVIQKGISVNNDGKNDTFDLTGFDVKKLTIFNRLGMKVYSRTGYVNEWGGKDDDGDELPDGTYYYVIDRNTGDTKTGWIYLNRAQ